MFPKLITIGHFFVPTYGTLVALGFLLGLWIATTLARRQKLPSEAVTNLAIYCALAGLIGAKLGMFLFDMPYYFAHPGEIFSLDTLQAAGVYQTGLLLALVTAIFYMRKTGLPVLKTSDVFAPGVAAGHAVGRLGCFSAGCCWGIECHLPWAVTFTNPDAHKLVGVPLGVPLHPTQLYEAFAETLICIFLLLRTRRAHAAGEILGWYLVLYSVARFLIEFFRNHEQATHLGLSLTQWISLGTLALGIWLLRPKSPKLAVSHS